MLLLAAVLLPVASAAGADSRPAPTPASKPNIVYILADDLGYGDVQCLNPQRGKISTPHLDRLAAQGHFASAGYRGYKADIWEGGHRVPFFVRWPGVVRAGSRSDAIIGLGDFMATTAELIGVRLPDEAAPDSVSFLPALHGRPIPPTRAGLVHHSQQGVFAVRQGNWKLIFCGGSGGYGKPTGDEAAQQGLPDAQLYDLAADPGETTNLIATHPTHAANLAAQLQRYVTEGRSTPGPALANDVGVTLPPLTSVASPSH